jgi:hypothetical protein
VSGDPLTLDVLREDLAVNVFLSGGMKDSPLDRVDDESNAPAGFELWVSLAGTPTDRFRLPPQAEVADESRFERLLQITNDLGVELLGKPGDLPY